MTKEEFEDLVQRLKRGDNSALSYLHPFQEKCARMLLIKTGYRCDRDQAYDIFVESVMDFRKNVLRDSVTYKNVQGYLRQMCWNKWLALTRTQERHESRNREVAQRLYSNTTEETQTEMEELHTARMNAVHTALQQLSDKCRTILLLAIAEELPMTEIARSLNMASADVAKTTKSRCYKKLLELVRNTPQL